MTESTTDNTGTEEGIASKAIVAIDKVAPKGWRLKLAKAAAQLLIGTRAGAAVYAEAREHLDEIEGRSAMNKQLYAVATQQIINDPEMVERAKARLVGGMLRKQENLEAVITGAGDKMLALPAPDHGGENTEVQPTSGDEAERPSGDHAQGASEGPLNPDWAAAFSEVAENATSEELRDRLSRMLVGEISSAGTFPRSTIRAIAELEQSDLQALVELLPFTHGNAILGDEPIDSSKLEILKDCGLVDYNPSLGFTATINALPQAAAAIAGKEWALMIDASEAKSVNFPVIPLTRVGKAVVSLLDQFNEEATFEAFAERMDKTNIKQLMLGKYKQLANGKINIPNGRIIFPKASYYSFTSGMKGNNFTDWSV